MKRNEPGTRFWIGLGTVNLLTLIYPVILLHRAKSVQQDIFANLIFLGSLLLLVVVNWISVVAAGAACPAKAPSRLESPSAKSSPR